MSAPPREFPRARPQGEAALLFYLGVGIDPVLNAKVRALARALALAPLPGVREVLAAYCCLQAQFDPLLLDHAQVQAWVEETLAHLEEGRSHAGAASPGRRVEVPVVYGGEYGPDLDFICVRAGLGPEEVISRHTGRDHLCYLVGFTPGFPFLGGLDPALAAPRLDSPRAQLPAGAVGVGADQTGLYPLGGPGGWRILGRTPQLIYDPRRDPPCLIEPGDLVRFRRVDAAVFPEPPRGELTFEPTGLPALEVLAPGSLTTVQDGGRWGWQHLGVPVSGALDRFGLAAANLLLGNPPQAPALEVALMGLRLKALRELTVAAGGAELDLRLDGQPMPRWTPLKVSTGQVLEFHAPKGGARTVLAVAGGLAVRPVLGSASTYILGCLGAPLAKGQVLRVWPVQGGGLPDRRPAPVGAVPAAGRSLTLRAVPGPNQDFFSEDGLRTLFNAEFRVSPQADRRGVRLEGPPVEIRPGGPTSIVSEPNAPGIVQVPPGGAPIILLNEQTVGGYAKAATVIGPDRDLLASALPGDSVRFQAVTAAQGVEAARVQARMLERIARAARE